MLVLQVTMGPNSILRLLVIGALLLLLVESIRSQDSGSRPILRNGAGHMGCYCKGRWQKPCPWSCRRKTSPPTMIPDPTTLDPDHGEHPDHIDDPDHSGEDGGLIKSSGVNRELEYSGVDSHDSGETIVRHRKVYVSDKKEKLDSAIHPIELTIPVRVQEGPVDNLPPPKPVFRMHKYTTVETKPQTELVPVTTTIFKPVGVSKDQIIE